MTLPNKDLIAKIGEEIGLPIEVVEKVYKAYWRFIRTKIEEIDFTKDEPHNHSFNIPSLGKFYTNSDKVKLQKKIYNDYQKN